MESKEIINIGLIFLVAWFAYYMYKNYLSSILQLPKFQLPKLPNIGIEGLESPQVQDIPDIDANVDEIPDYEQEAQVTETKNVISQNENVLSYPQDSNEYEVETAGMSCLPKDQLTSSELLPMSDPNNVWAQVNPSVEDGLDGKNFLDSGYHYGINTQGGSLKIANTGLRSDPTIPKIDVGPWNISSVVPDTNRREFEIGTC